MLKLRKLTAVVLAVIVAAGGILSMTAEASSVADNMFKTKFGLLSEMLKADEKTVKAAGEFGSYVTFLSISDGSKKAKVFLTHSNKLDSALKKSYNSAKASGITPKWLRLDIVVSDEEMSYKDFKAMCKEKRMGGMRYGIAFNSYYGTALLEEQINCSGILDYTEGKLDLDSLNAELKRMKKIQLSSIPSTLRLFKTQGYFTDNTSYAYKLTNGTFNNVGRRDLKADRATVEALADKDSAYLASICDKNGKFVYGYYPIDNSEIEGYNIQRHVGTVWDLIMQYEMCGDESLIPAIKASLGFVEDNIWYKDKKTAFLMNDDILNLGGCGLALLAFTTYEEMFCTGEYNKVIRALANGIMYMQQKDGSYIHKLYKESMKVAKEYVIVYYDGEATFGLLKAYGVLGDKDLLKAARKAADYFIDNDYVTLHSHWMQYAFNELTKYCPEEEYFDFALRNVDTDNYSATLYHTKSGASTASETANAAFDTYLRLVEGGYECAYLEEFNAEQLVKTVVKRAEYGLNYFMYPEHAMFFEAPDTVLDSFAVREDLFRIRIDDILHFMNGYYLYWKNYDKIVYYKKALKGTGTKKADTSENQEVTEDTGEAEETETLEAQTSETEE